MLLFPQKINALVDEDWELVFFFVYIHLAVVTKDYSLELSSPYTNTRVEVIYTISMLSEDCLYILILNIIKNQWHIW